MNASGFYRLFNHKGKQVGENVIHVEKIHPRS
jgi:hypothetical protein